MIPCDELLLLKEIFEPTHKGNAAAKLAVGKGLKVMSWEADATQLCSSLTESSTEYTQSW